MIQGEDWRAPIIAYLHHHYEPGNKTKLLKMQQREKAYQVIGNELYKTSITPLLRFLSKAKGRELLAEIHLGICGGRLDLEPTQRKSSNKDFLAPDHWRCLKNHHNMRSQSIVFTQLHSSILAITTHHAFVAAIETGHRHCGTVENSTRKLQL
jgi:hypothetical protein